LKLVRADLLFDADERFIEQFLLPRFFPNRVNVQRARIGHAFDRGSAPRIVGRILTLFLRLGR
jgi:hypothetical protein